MIKRLIPLLLVCSLLCTAGANAQSAFDQEPGFGPAQQEQLPETYSEDDCSGIRCEKNNGKVVCKKGAGAQCGDSQHQEPIPIKGLYFLLLAGAGYGIYRLHQLQ